MRQTASLEGHGFSRAVDGGKCRDAILRFTQDDNC